MRVLPLLLAAALIAGCIVRESPEAEPMVEAAAATPDAPEGEAADPTPSPTPSPTTPPPSAASTSEAASNASAPRTVVVEEAATVTAAVGAPCVSGIRPCSRGPVPRVAMVVEEAAPRSATLTLTWEPGLPTADVARVNVDTEAGELASVEGASPLVVELPVDALGAKTEVRVIVEPGTGKLFVSQETHLTLTLVYG